MKFPAILFALFLYSTLLSAGAILGTFGNSGTVSPNIGGNGNGFLQIQNNLVVTQLPGGQFSGIRITGSFTATVAPPPNITINYLPAGVTFITLDGIVTGSLTQAIQVPVEMNYRVVTQSAGIINTTRTAFSLLGPQVDIQFGSLPYVAGQTRVDQGTLTVPVNSYTGFLFDVSITHNQMAAGEVIRFEFPGNGLYAGAVPSQADIPEPAAATTVAMGFLVILARRLR